MPRSKRKGPLSGLAKNVDKSEVAHIQVPADLWYVFKLKAREHGFHQQRALELVLQYALKQDLLGGIIHDFAKSGTPNSAGGAGALLAADMARDAENFSKNHPYAPKESLSPKQGKELLDILDKL